MRIYVNGIDCGGGKVKREEQFVKVMYHEAMFPTYYPKDRCIFTTRFGEKCMIYGGDYSEDEIAKINEEHNNFMK